MKLCNFQMLRRIPIQTTIWQLQLSQSKTAAAVKFLQKTISELVEHQQSGQQGGQIPPHGRLFEGRRTDLVL